MSNQPLSEQYRLQAIEYVEAESRASLLEELKSATLSQMMLKLGDIAVNKAERDVKASDDWKQYITGMVEARRIANQAKHDLEVIRMKFNEQQSAEATARAERRM
jgi:hypothetical protein